MIGRGGDLCCSQVIQKRRNSGLAAIVMDWMEGNFKLYALPLPFKIGSSRFLYKCAAAWEHLGYHIQDRSNVVLRCNFHNEALVYHGPKNLVFEGGEEAEGALALPSESILKRAIRKLPCGDTGKRCIHLDLLIVGVVGGCPATHSPTQGCWNC